MAKRQNDFALGLWVLAVIVLFFGVLLFIGGQNLGRRYQAYAVRFPVTYALPEEIKPGAAVHCGGTRVGKVTDVSLRRGEGADEPPLWAYLQIEVDEIIELRRGCKILARGPLLGGGGKLIITDPGSNGALIEPGQVIDGAQAGTFETTLDLLSAELDPGNPIGLLAAIKTQLDPNDVRGIIGKVHRSLDDLNTITQFIEMQLDARQRDAMMRKLHAILDNVNTTTGQLRAEMAGGEGVLLGKIHSAMDSINAGLTDMAGMLSENRPTIRQTLANAQATAETVQNDIVEPIARELDAQNAGSMLAQVHEAFGKINASLADVQVVADRTKTLVVLNENRIQRLLANVTETSMHLKHASKDLRRNPWRLFYRPSEDQTKELNIFDAAREFSIAAERLDDSAVMLDALMKAYDGNVPAQAPELVEVRQKLKETFDDYLLAEEALWKILDVR